MLLLAQLAIKHPRVVFCLLTALQIHGLTTQAPHEVWVAISPNARAPQVEYPPLRVVRLSDPDIQIEQISLDGVVRIPVTSAAKTVVDCFKFRNKIGLDVALVANCASIPHDPAEIHRLDPDNCHIPYDWALKNK